MKDFEIKITGNLPFIHFNNLKQHDLCPVTEKVNSVLYILDDNCWEEIDGKFSLKIKLRHAVSLDLKIRELKDSGKVEMSDLHFVHLAEICRVYKTSAESDLDSAEKALYETSLNKVLKAIDEFNMASFMMGVSNG
jgi:hypothetical protein